MFDTWSKQVGCSFKSNCMPSLRIIRGIIILFHLEVSIEGCTELHPGKFTWNPKKWRFARWCSFSIRWLLISILILWGVFENDGGKRRTSTTFQWLSLLWRAFWAHFLVRIMGHLLWDVSVSPARDGFFSPVSQTFLSLTHSKSGKFPKK